MNNKTVFSGREPDSVMMAVLSPQEARYLADTYDFLSRQDGRKAFYSISLVWTSFADKILLYFAEEHRLKGERDDFQRLISLAEGLDLRPKMAAICNRCSDLGSFNEFSVVRNTLEIDLGVENDAQSLYSHALRLERCLRKWVWKVSRRPDHQPPKAA